MNGPIQKNGISRRGFLKQAALAGAAFCIAPAFGKVTAAEKAATGQSAAAANGALLHGFRILGSGNAAFRVSPIGFGCMGLNYHRSQHPDEKTAFASCMKLSNAV